MNLGVHCGANLKGGTTARNDIFLKHPIRKRSLYIITGTEIEFSQKKPMFRTLALVKGTLVTPESCLREHWTFYLQKILSKIV